VTAVIALVGRPNVGKSTLFNQLTRTRDALVADYAGLTRDRKYGDGKLGDRPYIVIDTGGITGDEAGIDAAMASQSMAAIDEADVVLLMVDGRAGLHPGDEALVKHLRQLNKAFHLVVNKIDGVGEDVAASDFYRLGIAELHTIAASHNRGVHRLIDDVLAPLPPEEPVTTLNEDAIRVAVVGRPNVGKSTLVNRLLGEDRVVVFDQPGTTRDSVYIDYERRGNHYTLIDTAGVRRRKNVRETVEKFSIVKTLKAIADAHVVILVMDAHEGIVEQDLHLLGQCIDAGRGLVIALNKWDGIDSDERDWIKTELKRRLQFVD
jgi:GTP-binding protein